jgi:hypothetical protein
MTGKQEPTPVAPATSTAVLEMGRDLEEHGKIHEALGPYLKVITDYSNSPEAQIAADRTMAIAEDLRSRGHHHVAMAVLDRLEQACEAGQQPKST